MTFAEFTARMRMMIQTMPHREQALRLLALGTLRASYVCGVCGAAR